LLTLFERLLNLTCLLEHAYVVASSELFLLLLEELCANICSLVQFLRFKLHVNEIGFFQDPPKLLQLLFLQLLQLLVQRVKEVDYALPQLVF